MSLLATLALLGTGALVLFQKKHAIGLALSSANLELAGGALVLSLLSMILRNEAWGFCLRRADVAPSRAHLHAAGAPTFLVGMFAGQAAAAAKVWTLRRLHDTPPSIAVLLLCDLPITAAEGVVAAVMLLLAAVTGGVPAWLTAVLVAGAAFAFVLLFFLERWLRHRRAGIALRMLRSRRDMSRLGVIVMAVAALSVMRSVLVLASIGVHVNPAQAIVLFITTGVVGTLPIGQLVTQPVGQSAATAALGLAAAPKAATGGLILGAVIAASACLYCVWTLVVIWVGERTAQSPAAPEPSS